MKSIFLTIMALLIAVPAFATGALMQEPYTISASPTYPGTLQMFSPDGSKTQTLSVASSTVNLTNYIMYAIYSASGTCNKRLMPLSTSTKASYTAVPVPNTSWHIRGKNTATPFLNMSGCVGGFVQLQ